MELALTPNLDLARDELAVAFERDRSRLLRIAHRILRDRDEAEDVVQHTLLAILCARRSGEIRSPSSYLARAVRWNAVKRQAQRARELPLEALPEATTDRSPGADRLDALELEGAIRSLPTRAAGRNQAPLLPRPVVP